MSRDRQMEKEILEVEAKKQDPQTVLEAKERFRERFRRRTAAWKLSERPDARDSYEDDEQFFVDSLMGFDVTAEGHLIVQILWVGIWIASLQVTHEKLVDVEVWTDEFKELIEDTNACWPGWLYKRAGQLLHAGVILKVDGTVELTEAAKIKKEAAEAAADMAEQDDALLEIPMALAAVREQKRVEIVARKRRQVAPFAGAHKRLNRGPPPNR